MATERISKYLDDAAALVQQGNVQKIAAEVKKLTTYIQKHQNETVPDGSKTKLFGAIEMYYRFAGRHSDFDICLKDTVYTLLSCFLQLPEGKLVTASSKRKVLAWQQELCAEPSMIENGSNRKTISKWVVDTVNANGSLAVFNANDNELWRENYQPHNLALFIDDIRSKISPDGLVTAVLCVDDTTETIVQVESE